ncbi:lycopene cyclase family protein [Phytohalomonas tamaricis]|uniref:lycopene cyclase family protein n=1 Tax=Phytohalomonas tamaricis TaxID=2081032 RepID=UPI000D0B4D9B|nr:lycopene cyclase family protein [Phytohalomonas tamaricis]
MNRHELLILGGGCAGLSLAYHLAQSRQAPHTLIIEPRTLYEDDRTWCGWPLQPHAFQDCIEARWDTWRITTSQGAHQVEASPYPYEMIRSSRVYAKALAAIDAHPNIERLTGRRVTSIEDSTTGVIVTLDDGQRYQARWAIDTLPRPERLAEPWLWQDFAGLEIEAPSINAGDIPELMDFRVARADALDFIYALPFAPQRALFEWTRFGRPASNPLELEACLIAYLDERFGHDYRVLRRETGSLPMAPNSPQSGCSVIRAGAYGGSMRASTGYAFHAIQRWAEPCAQQLLAGQSPAAPSQKRYLVALDEIYMTALSMNAAMAPEFYLALFKQIAPAAVVRFLAGEPSLGDIAAVTTSLPKRPFLAAACHWGTRHLFRP